MFASADSVMMTSMVISQMFRHIPTPPQLHTSHIAKQSARQEKMFSKLSSLDESTLLYLAIIIYRFQSSPGPCVSVASLTKLN